MITDPFLGNTCTMEIVQSCLQMRSDQILSKATQRPRRAKGQKDASPLKVRSFSITMKITTVCGPRRMYCTSLRPSGLHVNPCTDFLCLDQVPVNLTILSCSLQGHHGKTWGSKTSTLAAL